MMIDTNTIEEKNIEGKNIEVSLSNMFNNKFIEYIHVHNAKPDCFNCMVRCA